VLRDITPGIAILNNVLFNPLNFEDATEKVAKNFPCNYGHVEKH
jgi:hypothetical protein